MRSNLFNISVLLGVLASSRVNACPDLDPSGGYAEVAVPCDSQGSPDFSKEPVVNQANAASGECRTIPAKGKTYSVSGQYLLLLDRNGTGEILGTLSESPTCFQTDRGGPYYPKWVPLQFPVSTN